MSEAAAAALTRAVAQPFGAVIVVGPTGSGKSTTLHAALSQLDDDERAITTIEDPVEYQVTERRPDRGQPTGRADLRVRPPHDPPLRPRRDPRRRDPRRRDRRHRLPGRDDRPHGAQLAARPERRQRDRAAEGHGRRPRADRDLPQLHRRATARPQALPALPRVVRAATRPNSKSSVCPSFDGRPHALYRPAGCEACSFTGYTGRVGLFEVMPIRGEIRGLIESSTEEIFAAAVKGGMTTMREDGIRLALAGVTSLAEVRRVTGERMT